MVTTEARGIDLKIVQKDAERHVVYGWAYVAKTADGVQVVDHSDEFVTVEDLEKAMHAFMRDSRDSGQNHDGADHGNTVVECVVFTKAKAEAMGIPAGVVPEGAWVGVDVGAATFAKVKSGALLSFSIEGECQKVDA